MDLSLNEDQVTILDAVDTLTRPFAEMPIGDHSFALMSAELDAELAEGGFLDIAFDPDLGAVTAALLVERLARLPFAVEAASSALVRPLLGEAVGRPLCLIEAGRFNRPVRFLKEGATVLSVGEQVESFVATSDQISAPAESLYAYPVAKLSVDPSAVETTKHNVSTADVLTRWRVALAAEAAGLLAAALNSTKTHVSEREQFGRPIATFQAVRHRLAEAQVRTNGLYWLAMKAAATLDAGDAALAALHAQETIRDTVYDFHQFLGAMGMTLEHPLHLWTYRLKLLSADLGGRAGQALAAADEIWD